MNLKNRVAFFIGWFVLLGAFRALFSGVSSQVDGGGAWFWVGLVGMVVVIVVGVVAWYLLPERFTEAIADWTLGFYRKLLGNAPVSLGRIVPRGRGKKNSAPGSAANSAVGSGTITRQYRMNYFDPAGNSNKVWIGIAYSDGGFETRFGRVRDEANLVSKPKKFASQYAAEQELERKRREKLRKGYKDTVVLDNHVAAAVQTGKKDKLVQLAAEQI
ncbi:MAG: WGR domain-containing protein [Pyrinomonadaceae bacterium]